MTNKAKPTPATATSAAAAGDYVPMIHANMIAALPLEANSAWLVAAIDAIDPHVFEPGHDGAYTRALEMLAYQQRAEILALRATREQ